MRRRGTPQLRRSHVQLRVGSAQGRRLGDFPPVVEQRHLHPVPGLRPARSSRDAERAAVQIGRSNDIADVLLRNGFEPHRLPDTRHGRIPDHLRTLHLLPTRLVTVVRRVPDPHAERVGAFLQNRCDIEFKRRITALVAAQAHAVHPHVGTPVYGSEVQQYPVPAPFRRNRERPFIPQLLLRTHAAPYARER